MISLASLKDKKRMPNLISCEGDISATSRIRGWLIGEGYTTRNGEFYSKGTFDVVIDLKHNSKVYFMEGVDGPFTGPNFMRTVESSSIRTLEDFINFYKVSALEFSFRQI